jgi:hypothetical protein
MRLTRTFGIMSCMALVPLPAAANEIEDAKAAVLGTLVDPDSARFSDVKVKGNIVCGWVNAKTSHGGYGGKRLWIYTLERKNVAFHYYEGASKITNPDFYMTIRMKDGTCD